MHLNQNDFNMLLEGKISKTKRMDFAHHILDCDRCRADFQMLQELKQAFDPNQNRRKTVPLTYVAGVVALLLMSVLPLFWDAQSRPSENRSLLTQHKQTDDYKLGLHREPAGTFKLIDRVKLVNQLEKLPSWGRQTSIVDLIRDS